MAKSHLSEEFIDSDTDSENESVEYAPPKGYHQVKKFKKLTSTGASDKKEIWLIKVPKGFKFDELKKLPISFNPLEPSHSFKNNNKKFVISEDLTTNLNLAGPSTDSKYKILASDKNGSETLKMKKDLKISRFYNVSEKVEIPQIVHENVFKAREDVPVIKGLKPQHFATGYYATELDVTSDLEEDSQPPKKKVKVDQTTEKKEKKEKKDKKDKKEKKSKK
ncbi:hypothetical protein WICPIJ_003164 [Wickerhamomyces pijperi]|uniref:DNA-directed RNA polymerase I subunit RPA34 n=1 Tax=Wickerhamomyces pijperi TaxID=599730 RepID=A0A9P8QA48_WICPI|nr:hypothetical protein WICPIJ_003164 [Wickerhamomyces pijperi]